MPAATATIRVLVVDDHPVVCDGVRLLLSRYDEFSVVGSAESGQAAIAAAKEHHPDLILLDLRLPDIGAPELVAALRRTSPGTKVVLFTAHPENAVLQATMQVGVDGCLLKDAGTTDLAASLLAVMGGRKVFDPRLSTRPDLTLRDRLQVLGLTRREYEVLRLVATGQTNPEIAVSLALTRNTVKSYLQSAMQKLGARNRVESIAKAHEANLL